MRYETGPFWPSTAELAETKNNTLGGAVSLDGTPELGERYTIPARQGLALRVATGQTVTVINTHGTQVVDSWAFNAADLTEFMSMEHLRAGIDGIFPKPGDALHSNKRRPILHLTADTTPGVHDTLMAACDIWRFRNFGIVDYHDNCTDNMRLAMKAIGLDAPEVPSPFNLFMNIPVRDGGSVAWLPPVSPAGGSISFRAEMDVVFVMSACPQDQVPINGEDCVIVDAHVEVNP
ncbi:MAG: urea carboxylase-associated family protein [Pseudomonadota bacterium]